MLFVLVHGTFASGAPWTLPESKLCRAIKAAYPDARFASFSWSGDNLQESREEGATRLADWLVESNPSSEPNSCVVIAHSHGGNIATDAARDDRVRAFVKIVVCLATPFIERRVSKVRTLRDVAVRYILIGKLSTPFVLSQCADATWSQITITSAIGLLELAPIGLYIKKGDILYRLFSSLNRGRKTEPETIPLRVPVLAIAHRADEAYWYLNLITGAGSFFLLTGCVLSVVILWLIIGSPQLGKPTEEMCSSFEFSPVITGLFLVGGEFVFLFIALFVTLICDLLFIVVIGGMFHFFVRGSALLGGVAKLHFIPQSLRVLLQMGFGESYERTIAAPLRISRTPQNATNWRFIPQRFNRANSPLLHCSIYEDTHIINSVIAVLQPGYDLHRWESEKDRLDREATEKEDRFYLEALMQLEKDASLQPAMEYRIVARGLAARTAEALQEILLQNGISAIIGIAGAIGENYSVSVPFSSEEQALDLIEAKETYQRLLDIEQT